jgi:EAL domain-containing protein (putative c-di-GMP-specific phosphodiesterase class I)
VIAEGIEKLNQLVQLQEMESDLIRASIFCAVS